MLFITTRHLITDVVFFLFFLLSLVRFQEAQRHYKNASKMNSADLKPMTGLLISKMAELQQSEKVHKTAFVKIHDEIDHLQEFNRTTTGLSHVSAVAYLRLTIRD